jgi:signal peptidase I
MPLNQILLVLSIASAVILLLDFVFLARKRTLKAPVMVAVEYIFIFSALIYIVRVENFEYLLALATVFSGVVYLLDKLLFARLRRYRYDSIKERREVLQPEEETYLSSGMPIIVDYARSFFWVLLMVLMLRSFIFEPFRIPTGSLVPTLLPGDFILVNKFDYGVRLPVLNTKIVKLHQPQRGDIVVFRYPVNPKVDFIKRVVGLPGDTISYVNKVFFVNGQEATQVFQATEPYLYENGTTIDATRWQENLLGVKHDIYQFSSRPADNFTNLTVPEGMYFMIGDNRDDSADSRYWGFVPESYIVGKPLYVLFNWNSETYNFRWKRSGLKVQAHSEEIIKP